MVQRKYVILLSILCLGFVMMANKKLDEAVNKSLQFAQQQLKSALQTHTDVTRLPRSTKKDGSLNAIKSNDWTSGFFPGNLWYMYEYTKDPFWKEAAEKWTATLEPEKLNTRTHDLGFMLYCSFGNGYRLTGNPKYKEIMLEGAKSLISRFDPKVGLIRSWDHGKWKYPVIIDNMMNLEFLFWATKVSGDSVYYNVAVTHADNTIKHHFRPDNSSYHVIDYNPETGEVLGKGTHQGYSDESAWARGQAWGLYGYTLTYRETKDKKYLDQAVKIADYFINHPNTPKDKIPYWDFNAPNIPNAPRDASAAAITCSALQELQGYVEKEKSKKYKEAAFNILSSLTTSAYLAKLNENNNFLLMHSTGHLPGDSEIDVPLVYADYYFIESMLRYKELQKSGKLKF